MIGRHLEEAKEEDGLDPHYLDPNYGNEFDTQPYGEGGVDTSTTILAKDVLEIPPA